MTTQKIPSKNSPVNKIKKGQLKRNSHSICTRSQHFSGPIPPPILLEQYRQIIPDAPERILKMAEKSLEHLVGIDKEKLLHGSRQVKRGQIFAFFSVIFIMLVCAEALYEGYPVVAGILGSLDVAGIILAFMFGRQTKSPHPVESKS